MRTQDLCVLLVRAQVEKRLRCAAGAGGGRVRAEKSEIAMSRERLDLRQEVAGEPARPAFSRARSHRARSLITTSGHNFAPPMSSPSTAAARRRSPRGAARNHHQQRPAPSWAQTPHRAARAGVRVRADQGDPARPEGDREGRRRPRQAGEEGATPTRRSGCWRCRRRRASARARRAADPRRVRRAGRGLVRRASLAALSAEFKATLNRFEVAR